MRRGAGTGHQQKRDSRQLSLDDFYLAPQPSAPVDGSLNFDAELRAVISQALKDCPDGRHVVAARMSELTGQDISVHMLNSWSAESKENHRFPFAFSAAFEVATGSQALQLLLARKRGSTVFVGPAAREAQIAVHTRRLEQLRADLAIELKLVRRRR